jgi:flagellar basal-body rod modification protein FlgD
MSSVSATVKNGEIVTSASQNSLSEKKTESTGMDKDAFLQLLVAQMKYQDPLEPTSNTEYIAQYAQFSQVEALNNMSTTMELSRYSSYVGKEVVIETSDSSGNSNQVRGFVDYVTFEEGKAYFSIEGDLYAAEDMVSVISNQYSNAESIAKTIADTLKSLPAIDSISISANGNTISNLNSLYNSLSDYEKGFVDDDDAKLVSAYASKLNELIAQANYEAEQQAKKQAEEAAKETENETANEASAVNDSALTDAPSDSEISDEAINAIVTDNDDAGSSDGGDSEGSDDAEGV